MGFDVSLVKVLTQAPHRLDANGNVLQTLDGVFILFSTELVTMLKQNLTQAQKDELQTWVNVYSVAQCALWNVPVWAGETQAVYCRIPAAIWNDPTSAPPLKVRNYFQKLWDSIT